MGDSAGAHLCLALARYLNDLKLAEKGEDLGQPGGMFLFSVSRGKIEILKRSLISLLILVDQYAQPWVDMTSSGESTRTNAQYVCEQIFADIIHGPF